MEQDLDAFRALKVPLAGAGGRGARQNMTGDQRRALVALERSDNIIIKPADKAGPHRLPVQSQQTILT